MTDLSKSKKPRNRRLGERPKPPPPTTREIEEERRKAWVREREALGLFILDELGIGLSPAAFDTMRQAAALLAGNDLAQFERRFRELAQAHKEGVPPSARQTLNMLFPRNEDQVTKKQETAAEGVDVKSSEPAPLSDEVKSYIADLEAQITALDEQAKALHNELAAAQTMVELKDRQLTEALSHRNGSHAEAPCVFWTDVVVNGIYLNMTTRAGADPELVRATYDAHMGGLKWLYDREDVTELITTGKNGEYTKLLKGKSSQPKSAPPKDDPSAPPKKSPPPSGAGSPPPQRSGKDDKAEGSPAEQRTDAIIRVGNETGDGWTYKLPFRLQNGKQADRPMPVSSKRDVAELDKTLAEAGYDLGDFNLGQAFQIPMLVRWTWGGIVKGLEDKGARYHNNVTFEILDS